MSLARQHRDRFAAICATHAAGPATEGGQALAEQLTELAGNVADRTAAEIHLRLAHDLRRLKDIQSIERKIATKRELLPAYEAWIAGMLSAGEELGRGIQDEVLPTIMIWRIDTGDYAGALPLIDYVLEHEIALPSRYERTAPTLIAEEIAEAALKAQLAGGAFDLAVLEYVEAATAELDMHDQVRAKLHKVIGIELERGAKALAVADPAYLAAHETALAAFARATELDPRIGVTTRVKQLAKSIEAAAAAAGTAPPEAAD